MPSERPRSPERGESRDLVELRQLRAGHPELGPAVDLQLELLAIQRRVLARVPLPLTLATGEPLPARADGRALLRLSEVPINWTDLRSVFRDTTAALAHHEEIPPGTASALIRLAREGDQLIPIAQAWFRTRVESHGTWPDGELAGASPEALEQVLGWAFRPFLVRCAEALGPRLLLDGWQHGVCPACGAEPELAILDDRPDRLLVCGRCTLRWPCPMPRCVFCENDDPARLTTLASQDHIYQLLACEVCRRYLKAYDQRFATRPSMPTVDTIATLPLDAAALQRGYLP